MVQENKNNSISHLSSAPTRAGFKKILALMGLMTFSTLTTQAAQPINNYIGTEQVAKSPTDSIKNKAEYDAEYQKLADRIAELDKSIKELKEKNEKLVEQSDMLMGPVKFLERIQNQNGIVTETDVRFAKGGLRILSRRERLPELAELVKSARKILEYIANQPTQLITRN